MPTPPPILNNDSPAQHDRDKARAILKEVRESLPSLQVQGNFCKHPEQEHITHAVMSYAEEQAPHLQNDLRLMTKKFVSLFRQLHPETDMPDPILKDVISILHEELQANATALGTKAYHNLTSGTLYHGAVASQLLERFPAATRYNITKTLESGSGDPFTKLDNLLRKNASHGTRILEEKLANNIPSTAPKR